ncbi:MAG TPA: metallophosphoesterase family protein [Pyrinomonadaceae bacterium]|jgi:putative phosphoesterase|nr:metallophosphoesterase family protein [Pyrinomonadaceae bacterium]
MKKTAGKLVGVISDTHGLVRPEALAALEGSEMILHAGDIGRTEVLEAVGAVAPVTAVRGNNDRGVWAETIPERELIEVGGIWIYVLHDVKELDLVPSAAGIRVVVSGHSHKPSIEERAGVLYLNPGSAGPRRFKLPVTVARLKIARGAVKAELIELAV